jgi:alternate signal-mediated exported protein
MPRKDKLMNKYTKGAIATGAAIVLLLGGAGTFALWNDDAEVGAGAINSGTLTIAPDGTGEWLDSEGDPILDIATYLIVPGDVLTFTQDVVIDASGNNLEATLDYDPTSIVVNLADAPSVALKAALVVDVDSSAVGGAEIVPGDAGSQTVTVTVTFPDTVSGLTAQDGSVDLSALTITLTQHL